MENLPSRNGLTHRPKTALLSSATPELSPQVKVGIRKKRHKQKKAPGGAVPFWLEDGVPHIYVSVGYPPQKVPALLDTGSHLSWFHTGLTSANSCFAFTRSKSWKSQGELDSVAYLNNTSCGLQLGTDKVSIDKATYDTYDIPIGIALEENCKEITHSMIGLSLASDFLTAFAQNPKGRPTVFSFAFKDPNTGDGENWFSMGGYAGLDKNQIKWIPRPLKFESPFPMDDDFLVTIPHATLKNGETVRLKHNYAVGPDAGDIFVVDTGSANTFIPWTVEKDLYRDIPEYRKKWFRDSEGRPGTYGVFDLRRLHYEEYPRIGLQIGNREWLTSMANLNFRVADYLKKGIPTDEGNSALPVAFESNRCLEINGIPGRYVPSILGFNFLSELKGVVFDFTPGKERVGFVPREASLKAKVEDVD